MVLRVVANGSPDALKHEEADEILEAAGIEEGAASPELARIMGTSVAMIEAHYGALLDTAHDAIVERLESQAAWRSHQR